MSALEDHIKRINEKLQQLLKKHTQLQKENMRLKLVINLGKKNLEEKTAYLEKGMRSVLTEAGIIYTINRVGSMISVHFDAKPVYDFITAKNGDNETFKKFFHGLLNRGIYIAPSAYETWFITDALT